MTQPTGDPGMTAVQGVDVMATPVFQTQLTHPTDRQVVHITPANMGGEWFVLMTIYQDNSAILVPLKYGHAESLRDLITQALAGMPRPSGLIVPTAGPVVPQAKQ